MRLLVVGESPKSRAELGAAVAALGHVVDEAADGASAWLMLAHGAYDVVFAEAAMPRLSGVELTRLIRARTNAPYAFVAVCTPRDEPARGLDAVDSGADFFLKLPVDAVELELCLITAERVVAIQRHLRAQSERLDELGAVLGRDAELDAATGLPNARRLTADLTRLEDLGNRYDVPTCLALCGIDGFGGYREDFGDAVAAEMLRAVGARLADSVRLSDAVYRAGDGELAVILAHQVIDDAHKVAERLRRTVQAMGIDHPRNPPTGRVTVSIGLAGTTPGLLVDGAMLLRDAVELLADARLAGGNLTMVPGMGVRA
ncbi:MAG: diguanylate cyclase [Chloroflexota bacterium]